MPYQQTLYQFTSEARCLAIDDIIPSTSTDRRFSYGNAMDASHASKCKKHKIKSFFTKQKKTKDSSQKESQAHPCHDSALMRANVLHYTHSLDNLNARMLLVSKFSMSSDMNLTRDGKANTIATMGSLLNVAIDAINNIPDEHSVCNARESLYCVQNALNLARLRFESPVKFSEMYLFNMNNQSFEI